MASAVGLSRRAPAAQTQRYATLLEPYFAQ